MNSRQLQELINLQENQSDIKSLPMPELCSQELKSTSKSSHNLLVIEKKPTDGDLMHCEDFSDLQRLLRVTTYVLRAVDLFEAKRNPGSNPLNTLNSKEIASAELLWISHAQKELAVQKNFNTPKNQLGLFRDDKGL